MSDSEVSVHRPSPDGDAEVDETSDEAAHDVRPLVAFFAAAHELDDESVQRFVSLQLAELEQWIGATASWLYYWDREIEQLITCGTTGDRTTAAMRRTLQAIASRAWCYDEPLWVDQSEVLELDHPSAWAIPLAPGGRRVGLLLALGAPRRPTPDQARRASLTLGGTVAAIRQRHRTRELEVTQAELSTTKTRLERLLTLFEQRKDEVEAINVELRESNEYFHNMVAQAADAIITGDVHGRITSWNEGSERLFGYSEQEALGAHISRLHSTEAIGQGSALYKQALEGRAIADFETQRWTKDGREITVSLTLSPIRGRGDEVMGVVAICRDISDQRLREQTVKEENQRLRDRLLHSEKLALAGQLAAGVAHDINSPLTYIINNIDFLVSQLSRLSATPEVMSEVEIALGDINEGARRVLAIARDLKTFARNEQEQTREVDVNAALDGVLNMAKTETRRRARLVVDHQPVPPVIADESRLGQVFLNLLVNAAQAIPQGAPRDNEIRVRVYATDGQVHIEVRDTGEGIAGDQLRRIFDPFFTTKPAGIGSGLGLSICQGIIRGYGGDIEVRSTVGEGSVFVVSLPEAELDPTPPRERAAR